MLICMLKKNIDFEKALGNAVQLIEGPEYKYLDVNVNVAPQGNYAHIAFPVAAQGVGDNQRIGERIRIKHVRFEGYVLQTPDASGNFNTNPLRFTLVLDRQCNGTTAPAADVYDGAIVERLRRNVKNERRFIGLMDEWMTNNAFFPGTGGNVAWPFRFEMDCDIPMEHSAAAGAVSSVSGNLLLYAITGRNAPSGAGTEIRGYIRVRYLDD